MNGMDMNTGELLTDVEYLRQSVWRVLSTPLGSRIMRPNFGSKLPDLIDRPFNPSTRLALEAATSDALARWEPTFEVLGVEVEMVEIGVALITLTGLFHRREIVLTNIQIGRQLETDGVSILDGEGNTIEDGQGNILMA